MSQSDIDDDFTFHMTDVMERVLPFRNSKYMKDFCEKLRGEGLESPSDLLRASKEALENRLRTHAACNDVVIADAIKAG